MIDLHCHLDLYENALELLPDASRKNLFTLVVTTSPRAWLATSRVFAKYKNIIVALGLHPELVMKKETEFDLLVNSISKTQYIGEVGIDGTEQNKYSIDLQKSLFLNVLLACKRHGGGRVISIHSRGATTIVLDSLENISNYGKPVLHWFSGSERELMRALSLGCWFSVNPIMLKSRKGRSLIAKMPINRILPETDGPFTRKNGRPYFPWESCEIVLHELQQITGRSRKSLLQQMQTNLRNLVEM